MSTYSTNLALELIGTGEQAGTWGNTTNTNLGTLIEQAISGYVTQAVATGTDTTLTIPNGATGVARNMYIELTGTGGTNTNLIVPSNKKLYFIYNNSTGAVTVKVSGQTGVSVAATEKKILVSNGTDIVEATSYITAINSSLTLTTLNATSANITTLSGTAVNYGSATISTGNLTFSSTGQRITGDFSNATRSNRLMFQNSVTNGASQIQTLPNGTATTSGLIAYGTSDPDNANTAAFLAIAGAFPEARISSGITGTASYTDLTFYMSGSERMRLDTSGNLLIGNTSSLGGQPLFVVNPTTAEAVAGIQSTSASGYTAIDLYNSSGTAKGAFGYGNASVGVTAVRDNVYAYSETNLLFLTGGTTERMRIDSSGNVGIGGTAEAYARVNIQGTLPTSGGTSVGFLQAGTVPSGSTNSAYCFHTNLNTQAASFTCANAYHYSAYENSKGAGSSITNQYGFYAWANLTGATNNYGFYSNIDSAANRWNFYAAGTARNYFAGGVEDAAGNLRAIPRTGSAKTSTYTLSISDVGQFVELGTGGGIDVPNGVFSTGDVVSVFNNTTGNCTISLTITTAYIAGTDADKASVTLATRGVATVLFISNSVCVVSGNVT